MGVACPRRCAVERPFDWLMHHRRQARDYETHRTAVNLTRP
ncbi:hypothetical protein SRB17_81630 [Streptomyces sp. RB17]|nr:hypothetical protein [Streptomyces sp. RB17]